MSAKPSARSIGEVGYRHDQSPSWLWQTVHPPVHHHRTVYDFANLEQVLIAAGFKDVRRYDWRQTEHKDYDDFSQAYIPHMDKENGILISLNVEATK
ncbi:MAG: hypothetical protein V3T02_08525 [Alphaproteobacteria bacterium]